MWYVPVIFTTIGFLFMEGFSHFFHKHVLHGILWHVHRTHHRPSKSFFELNDAVSLFFGLLSTGLIVFGFDQGIAGMAYLGIGMAIYGMLYFILHDVVVHRRVKGVKYKPANRYFAALRRAHMQHHRHLDRTPGESYGLFIFPAKFYHQQKEINS